MGYKAGDIFYEEFPTCNVSGVSTNLDSAPLGVLTHNGVDDSSAAVFFTNIDVGRYVTSGVIPFTYNLPSVVGVAISGYMGGLLTKGTISFGELDRPTAITGANVWTTTEMAQFRYKLGLDGTTSIPVNQWGSQLELSNSGIHNISIETGVNFGQLLSIMGAVIAGSSTVNGNLVSYFGINNNNLTRLVSTAVSGARQSVVLTLPSL